MSEIRQTPACLVAIDLELSNTQAHLIVSRAWVVDLIIAVCQVEQRATAEISVALVNDAAIRVINAQYLGHDWPTDVISFPDAGSSLDSLDGEIVVSAEMAVRMAHHVGCSPAAELALYLVHGLLHLCGHDDHSPNEVALMRQREAAVLAVVDITTPFEGVDSSPVSSDESGRESVRWPR